MQLEVCVIIAIVLVAIFVSISIYFYSPGVEKFDKNKSPHYEDIKKNLNTTDLIFFCGETYNEKAIRWVTGCNFSHVGMIVKHPKTEELFLWEADIGQGEKKGPRLINLKQKLNRYKGSRVAAWIKVTPAQKIYIQDIVSIISRNKNKKMQQRMYTWFLSNFPNSRLFNILNDENKVFCSELVADTYQRLALIKGDKPPSYYAPKDFFNRKVELQPGVKLDKPIIFTF